MSAEKSKTFVIDAGNTRLKLACFQNDELLFSRSMDYNEKEVIKALNHEYQPTKTLIAGVISDQRLDELSQLFNNPVVFHRAMPLPLNFSAYTTFDTLGLDRIANAVAADYYGNGHALVIDAGTCIKFDLVENHNYLGGSISPGIEMRFNALHQFTDKLPLVEKTTQNIELIGSNTEKSILSGVINGARAEVNQIISQYTQQFPQLTIFLTGGDAKIFDNALKSSIFVDQNFTLKGLFLILKHNASI